MSNESKPALSNESKQVFFIAEEHRLRQIIREEFQAFKGPDKKLMEYSERLDRKEAAQFLGISYASMYSYVKTGKIPEHGHAKKKFYYKSELIEALENADKEK